MGIIRSLPYKYIVAAAFVLGVFMDILDTTSTNAAATMYLYGSDRMIPMQPPTLPSPLT